jgi:hypothetical protein
MFRRVPLARTNVSEEGKVSIIRVLRIGELGTTLVVTSNRRMLRRNNILRIERNERRNTILAPDSCHLDDGGDVFLRNVGFYKGHTV